MTDNVSKLLKIAAAEVGYKEEGTNHTKFGDWLWGGRMEGADAAWCCAFVAWCFDRAGLAGAVMRTGRCQSMLEWARKNGLTLNKTAAQPGDLLLYSWNHDGKAAHIGIVEKRLAEGYQTIEGNTSNAVKRMTRKDFDDILCAVRPAWDTVTASVNESAPSQQTYTVRKGDTLTRIASRHSTTVDAIVKLNGIKNPNLIITGQKLRIPQK